MMGLWFVRNLVVAGAPLSAGGLRTLFLTEYNDLFSYARDLSQASYLAWGLDNILLSKAEALGRNLLVLFGMEYHLLPFAVVGLWGWRRRPVVQTFLLYALGLYLAMSLVFTFPSGRGSMLHSSAALLPWLAAAAVAGIDRTVLWLAARRTHWNPHLARRNFLIIFVLFAVGVSLYLTAKSAATWDDRKRQYDALAVWFAEHAAPADLVMLVDPPGFFYSSGRSSVVTPSDGPEAAALVARRYGVRYLALEAVHAQTYRPLYRGEQMSTSLQRFGEVGDIQIYRFRDVP
ncbi:MAG: hypothetical protein HY331_03985 [Chloroflexi bacterium]|nr:hypothetical protein [Chloroflexota bacterium]